MPSLNWLLSSKIANVLGVTIGVSGSLKFEHCSLSDDASNFLNVLLDGFPRFLGREIQLGGCNLEHTSRLQFLGMLQLLADALCQNFCAMPIRGCDTQKEVAPPPAY